MQLTLEGKTIDEVAIERIQMFEPPEGFYGATSGGKDSIVMTDLAKRAKVKIDFHYHLTTCDPPQVIQFLRLYHPEVEIVRPPKSMWQLCSEPAQGMLPLPNRRWCCELLKETGGPKRTILTGLRWAESARRAKRKMVEADRKDPSKRFVSPIIDWSDGDVWQYIRERQLPYCSLYDEGFKRLGCVLCPMVEGWQLQMQIERWPKVVQAWRNAANRVWEMKGRTDLWKSGDEYFDWWLSREGLEKDTGQATFDDCLVPFSD